MARNTELVRQWEILRAVDSARHGVSIATLAAERQVHPRTIRRDIEALCRAGFPLYDEKVNGTPMWKLRARPFQALDGTGLGLPELAALYFGHSMLAAAAGAAFENDGERALLKLERAMPQPARRLIAELPRVLNAKKTGRKRYDERKGRDLVSRVLDAITKTRRVTMRYASASSGRTRTYLLEPHRLSCADGGVYLTGWVAEYEQMRTFALERIETLAIEDERFETRPLHADPFTNSLGAYCGPSEPVALEFGADAAGYVRGREWHRSQEIEERPDGSILMRLAVSVDLPLRRWILSFGAAARVVGPSALAREIGDQWRRAADRYRRDTPKMARMNGETGLRHAG